MSYAYNAEMICDNCANAVMKELDSEGIEDTGDTNEYPQYANSDESDSPDHCGHCGHCGEFLGNDLTTDGYDYAKEIIDDDVRAGRTDSVACTVWAPYYGISIEPKTPVNSIEIPQKYIDLCTAWHDGIDCKLYAICSTGGLTTGTHCPTSCDDDSEKWYLYTWRELAADLCYTVRIASDGHDVDYPALIEFAIWVDCIVEQLEEEYGLEDWDG